MATRHIYLPVKSIIVIAFLTIFNNTLHAQYYTSANSSISVADTAGKYLFGPAELFKAPSFGYYLNSSRLPVDVDGPALRQELQATISKSHERKKLMSYLRELDINDDKAANKSHKKLFYNLANAFARLKLYPLAMKCFFKTLDHDAETNKTDSLFADTADFNAGYLNFTTKDDTLLNNRQGLLVPQGQQLHKSAPINYQNIIQTFNDDKKAVAYAMLIHVKQPIPGKRKVYLFANSGHTYITLIKYNSDSSYVSLSFGFYPKKNHLLAGTPLFPSAGSIYRNDANYKWDEVTGKFISKRSFEKILALTKKYDGLKYHLSTNNCTDFSLKAALMADIHIEETVGNWPLGHGNNPGITGQSLLQGKVYNGQPGNQNDLFLDHDEMIVPIK
jgi:hypothetical protein